MTLKFDFFFSFRSPYSYLATPQIAALVRKYDAEASLRVVLPIAVRIPGFFAQVNPLWPPYLLRDTFRIAQMKAIPYRWPRPDPIAMTDPRTVAPDQPRIYRVSRLGAAAAEAGKGLEFACEAAKEIWSGSTDNWHEGDHLVRAAERAGLDGAALDAKIAADPAKYDAIIAQNQEDQTKLGHWGVPLFGFEGEPFFGQDRIDHLLWRMEQKGLKQR
jgi:2-hydroxychromene-2-carboxylate isomerase